MNVEKIRVGSTPRVRFTLWFLLFLFLAAPVWAKDLVIYMGPTGSDIHDGSMPDRAVLSLGKALELANEAPDPDVRVVRITVAPGIYRGQTATTAGMAGGRGIIIASDDPQKGRPVFDGEGNDGTWLILNNASGRPTNITIAGLEIKNYLTAISLNGNRDVRDASNGGNVIRDNIFRNIGQSSWFSSTHSTAAVRFVNSDDNIVAGNTFINIRNKRKCHLLHSLYIAHDSTRNTVSENLFQNSCGDAIRFRDGSNDNRIVNNTFTDAWEKNPASDWYCDPSKRSDCTKVSGECPSKNNLFEGNRVVVIKLKPANLFMAYGADATEKCPASPGDQRAVIK